MAAIQTEIKLVAGAEIGEDAHLSGAKLSVARAVLGLAQPDLAKTCRERKGSGLRLRDG